MRILGEPRGFEMKIPYPPMPKKRPRVTANGTFMPKEYTEWKANVATMVMMKAGVKGLSGPLSLVVEFRKESMFIMVSEGAPERFGQADIDNLLGGLMDALQDSGTIQNDRQFSRVLAEMKKEE